MPRPNARDPSIEELLDSLAARLSSAADALAGAKGVAPTAESATDLMERLVATIDRSFITPFDREDVYRLGLAIEDAVEAVDRVDRETGRPIAALIGDLAARIEAAVRALGQARKQHEFLQEFLRDFPRAVATARRGLDEAAEAERAILACREVGRMIAVVVLKGV